MDSYGEKCTKYTLFLFNFVFILGGLCVVVLGVIMDTNGTTSFINEPSIAFSVVVIIIGIIVFCLAFFGCCGAMRETSWKLIVYGVLVILIFLCEVAIIAIAFGFHGKTETFMKENMKKSLEKREKADASLWDKIQKEWYCCGIEGPYDYKEGEVPLSCCKPGPSSCAVKEAYQRGCYKALQEYVDKNITVFASVAAIVGVCQIMAAAAAFWLASKINRRSREGNQPQPQAPPPQQQQQG